MFAEGDLFSAPIFGHPPFPRVFRILCKTGLQPAPKMGSISETSDLAQV